MEHLACIHTLADKFYTKSLIRICEIKLFLDEKINVRELKNALYNFKEIVESIQAIYLK